MITNEAHYLIPEKVLKAVGDYLSERPWREVQEVMPILQHLERHVPQEPGSQEAEKA